MWKLFKVNDNETRTPFTLPLFLILNRCNCFHYWFWIAGQCFSNVIYKFVWNYCFNSCQSENATWHYVKVFSSQSIVWIKNKMWLKLSPSGSQSHTFSLTNIHKHTHLFSLLFRIWSFKEIAFNWNVNGIQLYGVVTSLAGARWCINDPIKDLPVSIYLLKVNNRSTRTRREIYSKLTIKTPVVLMFLLLTLDIFHTLC